MDWAMMVLLRMPFLMELRWRIHRRSLRVVLSILVVMLLRWRTNFFSNGGNELAVYMQDYYPDWSYNSGNRPSDSRTYVLDVPVDDPSYGTYTNGEMEYGTTNRLRKL